MQKATVILIQIIFWKIMKTLITLGRILFQIIMKAYMQCLSKKPSMPYTQNELDLVCSSNTVHLNHTIAILNNTLPPKALPQKKTIHCSLPDWKSQKKQYFWLIQDITGPIWTTFLVIISSQKWYTMPHFDVMPWAQCGKKYTLAQL